MALRNAQEQRGKYLALELSSTRNPLEDMRAIVSKFQSAKIGVKRLRSIHHKGDAALEAYRRRQQGRTDQLLGLLYDLVSTMQQEQTPEVCLTTMQARVGEHPETIMDDCLAYTAYAENNYFPFLWRFYKSHRQTLFGLLDHLRLHATSQDTAVEAAVTFLRLHRTSTRAWLELPAPPLDLSWVPEKWWKLVTGTSNRTLTPQRVDRRHFEVCVFSQVMTELLSGDLCIAGSGQFADYRTQLIPWEDYTDPQEGSCDMTP